METLLFDNAVFRKGLNFTVRLDEKWKYKVAIGDFVQIYNGCLGEITKIYVCRLAEIPQEVFEHEHDKVCRSWEGLIRVLKVVYPNLAEKMSEEMENIVVTCLGFRVYERQ